jgi:hypothetical protein
MFSIRNERLSENHLEGDQVALSRLSSLFIKVERWFIVSAGLFIAICIAIGLLFFLSIHRIYQYGSILG